MPKTMNTIEFIYKATQIHGDKYDYSATNYVKMRAPVIITCPTHGDFLQLPVNHLRTDGCSKCGHINKHVKRKSKIAIEGSSKITDEQSIAKKAQLEILEDEITKMTSFDIDSLLHNHHFVNSIKMLMSGTFSYTDILYDKTFNDTLTAFTSDNFSTLSDKLKFTDEFISRYKHLFDWRYISGTQKFSTATIIKFRDCIDFRTYIAINKDYGHWLFNQVIDLNHDIVTIDNYLSLGPYISNCKFSPSFVEAILTKYNLGAWVYKPGEDALLNFLNNPNLQESYEILKPFIDKILATELYPDYTDCGVMINCPEHDIMDRIKTINIKEGVVRLLKHRLFSDEFLDFLLTYECTDGTRKALYALISTYQLPSESFIIKHKYHLNISNIIIRRTSHNMKFTISFYETMQDMLVGKSIDALRLYAFNNEVPVVVRALLNAQEQHPTIMPSPYLEGDKRTTIFAESEVTIVGYSEDSYNILSNRHTFI